MEVCAVPADSSGCGAVRVVYPCRAVEASRAVRVRLLSPQAPQRKGLSGEVPVALDAGDAEVVVLHRPAHKALVDVIPVLQAEGRAVVVDIDDNLSAPHPDHQWARSGSVSSVELARACAMADLVTVSTPALAEVYGAHGRVAVLRNCVPEGMLRMGRESDGKTLGWGGVVVTHPGDLPVTGGAVAEALDVAAWRFKVIGGADRVRAELGLYDEPASTGGLEVEDYQQQLGTLDVGIAPLGDTPFNWAKSGLKPLEYAARGVPFVASPTPEYRLLVAQGAGLLASSPGEWFSGLRDLMRDESLRHEKREQGYMVARKHTYEAHAQDWVYAWSEAITNRRAR